MSKTSIRLPKMTGQRLFIISLVFAGLIQSAPSHAADEAERGREVAVQHCSRCHVIPDHNPTGGIGSTPSFSLLARLNDGLERFETFFDRRPHPSFVRVAGVEPPTQLPVALEPVELRIEDIDAITAYAKKLRAAQ
ncbi:MAG: hypothetical protein R3245_01740 [Kiloniellales bacterium]|nr:hypothetical protein [Kiloniellales bacterium]